MSSNFLSSIPRNILWTLGILALLIGLGLARLKFDSRPSSESTPLPLVTVLAVRASDLDDAVTFTGAIAAREEAALSAEGEGGRVAGMFAEVGDRVRAGAVLARIDTSFVAQVASLEASLEESRANAAVAEADYRRAQAVAVSGALSVQEIERRGAASVATAAKVKVVGAQLSEARERLRRTEIRAPFDGIILARSAEVGQLAGPGGAPLFRIGRAGAVEMRGNIAEKDLPRLSVGQSARVRVTGVGAPFEGRVRLIGAVIDPQSRLGSVRIDLKPHPDLRPGAFARGEVDTGARRAVVLPQTAVMSDATGSFVMTVGAEDKVLRRPVTAAGMRTEGVVITAGLADGERVIVTAAPYLREGEQVRVAP
jgi:RND family efflux transporter MFP subunit